MKMSPWLESKLPGKLLGLLSRSHYFAEDLFNVCIWYRIKAGVLVQRNGDSILFSVRVSKVWSWGYALNRPFSYKATPIRCGQRSLRSVVHISSTDDLSVGVLIVMSYWLVNHLNHEWRSQPYIDHKGSYTLLIRLNHFFITS